MVNLNIEMNEMKTTKLSATALHPLCKGFVYYCNQQLGVE